MGEYTLSKYHLDKAKEYGFNNSECKNTLSSILIHENKLGEAEQILNTIPDVPESFFNIGMISLKRNDEVKAKELFNEYIKYFGNKKPYPPPDIMKNMIKLKNGKSKSCQW